jgi:hypothetical protein
MTLGLKLAALGGVLLLGLSMYPGVLPDMLFFGVLLWPLWLPAIGIVGVFVLLARARAARMKPVAPDPDLFAEDPGVGKTPVARRRWIVLSPAIIALSLVLVSNGIPKRVAFGLSRAAFERHIATAPVSEYEGVPLERWLGVYYVDRYAADPRGGVYFRTHAGVDGIGPDTKSDGFAYRPNSFGSPFGDAGYGASRLVGDWYVFSASDD